MVKDVQFLGQTAVPSDYDSRDGELDMCFNLINENGALHPLRKPRSLLRLGHEGTDETVLAIHDVRGDGDGNLLIARGAPADFELMWLPRSATNTSGAVSIAEVSGFKTLSLLGNIVALSTAGGMRFLLWRDGSYINLGEKPPFPAIDFGLVKAGTLNTATTYTDVPISCVPSGQPGTSSPRQEAATAEELQRLTQQVYGHLLSAVNDKVTAEGYFYQPFFVRYAYRLFDGTHRWQSAPILMVPTTTVPLIKITNTEDGSDANHKNVACRLDVPYFSLYSRLPEIDTEALANWRDLIAAIDIFVSAPIYLFDQSKDLGQRPWYDQTGPYEWLDGNEACNNDLRGRAAAVTTSGEATHPGYFVGHYADNATAPFIDHVVAKSSLQSAYYWALRRHSDAIENIKSAHEFYKVAEIPFDKISTGTAMAPLNLSHPDMKALVSRQRLADDYLSHCSLSPAVLHTYNGRLNMADVDIFPARPLPIRSCVAYDNPLGIVGGAATIRVYSRRNGRRVVADVKGGTDNIIYGYAAGGPRYIFYPDPTAYRMEITVGSVTKRYRLTPHNFLNGAYYFGGLGASLSPETIEEEPAGAAASAAQPSKLYTSDVNNPFSVQATNINTVGSGRILALSSAAKALSQGQFGQFPLYAFTSEGVWALSPSSTGSFAARQPIARDVLASPSSLVQLDSAVAFAARGIMILSGAQVQCISDVLDGVKAPGADVAPTLDKLGWCRPDNAERMPDFLKGCGLMYDYTGARLIVFRPDRQYSYVYSLRSQSWAMAAFQVSAAVNSYTDTLAVTVAPDASYLADFSGKGGKIPMPAVAVTRPLKLDTPYVLKKVSTLVLRGVFARGHASCLLQGSRDLLTWHPVRGSASHELRNFSGSPYKWFRLAFRADLGDGESISGVSIDLRPRMNNRLR